MVIPVSRPPIIPEVEGALNDCLKSGWWGYGPACHALEGHFTRERGGWALATSNCTSALHLAAKLLYQSPRDEVIVPAITFVSTPMAFLSAGFKVRIADVNPETLMADAGTIAPLLNDNTRAVVLVHLYGQRAAAEEVRALCDRHGVVMVEDCAHRLGLDDEAPVGDYACYSFNAVKEAPCGEGGLLWGRDESAEARARAVSNLGLAADTWQRSSNLKHADYNFSPSEGLKLRLNDISAAIVNVMLRHRVPLLKAREEIFRRYDAGLAEAGPALSLLERTAGDSFLMYVLRVHGPGRERLRAALSAAGVATSTHYPSLSKHPLFKEAGRPCPVAEDAAESLLTLPCFPDLTPEDQGRVIESVKGAAAWHGSRPGATAGSGF